MLSTMVLVLVLVGLSLVVFFFFIFQVQACPNLEGALEEAEMPLKLHLQQRDGEGGTDRVSE